MHPKCLTCGFYVRGEWEGTQEQWDLFDDHTCLEDEEDDEDYA